MRLQRSWWLSLQNKGVWCILEKCFSRSQITGSSDPFISVGSAARGTETERKRESRRNVSRLCIYFCNTLPCGPAARYSPPLRTISMLNDTILLLDKTPCTSRCIVQVNRLFISPDGRTLLSSKLSPDARNAKFASNTKLRALDGSDGSQTFHYFCSRIDSSWFLESLCCRCYWI